MAQLTFTQENLPTSEEFQLLLLEAWLSSNPLDELRAFLCTQLASKIAC